MTMQTFKAILHILRGRRVMRATRPDSLGIVRDVAVRRNVLGITTVRLLRSAGIRL